MESHINQTFSLKSGSPPPRNASDSVGYDQNPSGNHGLKSKHRLRQVHVRASDSESGWSSGPVNSHHHRVQCPYSSSPIIRLASTASGTWDKMTIRIRTELLITTRPSNRSMKMHRRCAVHAEDAVSDCLRLDQELQPTRHPRAEHLWIFKNSLEARWVAYTRIKPVGIDGTQISTVTCLPYASLGRGH